MTESVWIPVPRGSNVRIVATLAYRAVRKGRRASFMLDDGAAAEDCHRALSEIGLSVARGDAGETPHGEADATLFASRPPGALLRVVLFGLGVVNGGVYNHLRARPELFEVVKILVSDPARHSDIPPHLLTRDPCELFAARAGLAIEALPGGELAEWVIERCLSRNLAVVSANKAALAKSPDLEEVARRRGVFLAYSAAVGGGAPVLETVRRLRAEGERIETVEAVINGTTNFVLDRIAQGQSLSQAIQAAIEAGFAEADPSADLSGQDALNKLILTARAAWGREPVAKHRKTEDLRMAARPDLAPKDGVARHLATLTRDAKGAPRAGVRLAALPANHFLAGAKDEENRVIITCESGRVVRLRGKGAGRGPTAESVLSDCLDFVEQQGLTAIAAA